MFEELPWAGRRLSRGALRLRIRRVLLDPFVIAADVLTRRSLDRMF